MSKRKRQRMHSREQRRANRAALLADPPSQEVLDRRLIESLLSPSHWVWPRAIAEAWRNEREECAEHKAEGDLQSAALSVALMRALERRFQALTGDVLTVDYAEALIEPDHYDLL